MARYPSWSREAKRLAKQRQRARWKAAGLCYQCGRDPGRFPRCFWCRVEHAAYMAQRKVQGRAGRRQEAAA